MAFVSSVGDSFNSKQKKALNSLIVSCKNRWKNKTKVTEIRPHVGDSVEEASGIVSGEVSYQYGGALFQSFYLDAASLEVGNKIKLLVLKHKILGMQLTGNYLQDYSLIGDASFYLKFEAEDNIIYVTKKFPVDKQFSCQLFAIVDD